MSAGPIRAVLAEFARKGCGQTQRAMAVEILRLRGLVNAAALDELPAIPTTGTYDADDAANAGALS